MACWAKLQECFFDVKYRCTGESYVNHLRTHKCPAPLTEPMFPPFMNLLVFGPSYVGQIWKELACVHNASGLMVSVDPDPRNGSDHFMTAQFINNSSMTLIANNEHFQPSMTFASRFPNLLYAEKYTHAMYMEPHPDCHFQHERCVPIGDGVVADRAPLLSELIAACATRAAFSTHFGIEDRAWMHIIAWAGLFSRTNLEHGELHTCESSLLPRMKSKAHEGLVTFDARTYLDNDRCSVKTCETKGSGHQCSPGRITQVSMLALEMLLAKVAHGPEVAMSASRELSYTNASDVPPITAKKARRLPSRSRSRSAYPW